MKVYEVVAQGAVDGGYIYAEQSIAIFSTLEKAVEFARSRPVDELDLWEDDGNEYYLDSIERYSVFERDLDSRFSYERPLFKVGSREATLKPAYDGLGYESGLWRCVHVDKYGEYTYDMLDIRICKHHRHYVLDVWQYPDWDGESYDESGHVDSSGVRLGMLDCDNPFDDDDAASVLFEWLCRTRNAVKAA